jgi:hypothetical protein
MIEQLYYISGTIFFLSFSFLILEFWCFWKKAKSFFRNKMTEPDITYPDVTAAAPTSSELDKYRLRLIQAHVKTEDDLGKMNADDIKKLYLKHEQKLLKDMSTQISKIFVKMYSKTVANVIPIESSDQLENSLNNDVFIKAAINEYFPTIFYSYGAYLAPLSIATTTAAHVDYKKLKEKAKKFSPFKNASQEESNESETSGDPENSRDTENSRAESGTEQ